MDLTEFLAARLGEDEADWQREKSEGSGADAPWMVDRMLRETEAKRKILAEHQIVSTAGRIDGCMTCHDLWEGLPNGHGYCATLLALAAVYSDHPDYSLMKVP